MNDALAALYQSVIMEHHKAPRNYGALDGGAAATADNPLCGDRVTVGLRLEGGRIAAARFTGQGCALCRAAASLMTLAVQGLTAGEALRLREAFARSLRPEWASTAPDTDEDAMLGDLRAFAGVREFPSRARCALLPFDALRSVLLETAPLASPDS